MLKSGFVWPSLFKGSHKHLQNCDRCQRVDTISRINEMPLNNIQEVEIFYVWGIDFMGLFPPLFGKLYILLGTCSLVLDKGYVLDLERTFYIPSFS